MDISYEYLDKCIATLNRAYSFLLKADPNEIEFELYRSACIKEFEIILEQSGKLLRKRLRSYLHSIKAADKLIFKDVFRHAALRGLLTDEEVERWLNYRDNRNNTAHDYGVNFAEETIVLLPQFIEDATNLASLLKSTNEH